MIKNLLWKQAMQLAKKKFGDLNTNEANKWLVDKYNALLGKENTKNIANKIRDDLKRDRPFDNWKPEVVENDPFKNLRGNESFDELIELGGKKLKKFNPFKKEGKKIDFMDYYTKRKRGEFDDGGIILPQPKPYNFEEKLDFLREIKGGVGPKMYLQMMSDTLNEGVEKEAITKEERDNFLKRFTGTISEGWTSAIDDENLYLNEGDYERYPPKKFDNGGFTGSPVYFQDKFNEYDFATRYNNMSVKEGWDQMLQDIKNTDFIQDMKMEEGESGKLPPIFLPKSILMRLGLGSLIKNMRSPKGLYEKLKETPESPLLVSDFKTLVGGKSRRDFLQLLFGKKKKYSKQEIDQLKKLDDSKIRFGKNLEKFWKDFYKSLDDGSSKPTMPKYEIDTTEEILKKAIDKKTTFHAEGGLAGMLGETQPQTQQVGYATDRNKIIQELYDAAGGFDGTGKTFSEFMADVLFEGDYLAKGGRVGLKDGGMTPSEKWMRNYYFDGKGGYDQWMSFQEFQMGPGVDLWNSHIGKKDGGIIGLKNGGLLKKYEEYAPKGPWTKGLTDMEITYELYNLLEPYMSLFMKEGGRVGFKEGKGMTRRTFLKLMGGAAALPIVGKYFKLAKPAAKAMDDIKISLRGDGDWENIDGMWSGGNWVNYSFEALTDKGRKILAKLSKGKNASLADEGNNIYSPVSKSDTTRISTEADAAVDAVYNIKKSKGNISLNTQVGSKVKGAKPEKYKDMDMGYSTKTYGSKEITKKNILDEADDLWVGDYGGYRNRGFYDENVEDIIDIITKKAEGGRVGLSKGGLLKLLETVWNSKFLNKKFLDPKKLADETDDAGRELRKRNLLGQDKWSDIPKTLKNAIYTAAGGTGIATLLKYIMNKRNTIDELKEDNVLQDLVEKAEGGRITDPTFEEYLKEREMIEELMRRDRLRREFDEDKRRKEVQEQKQWAAEGGRIGLDAGGPPVSPANLHPLQRPMFYQGGLTKTVPPERGPMPQGLQSNVYDGIMRPGVINGRN